MKATTSHPLSTANESNQINRTISEPIMFEKLCVGCGYYIAYFPIYLHIEIGGLHHDTALLTRVGGCGQSLYPKYLKTGFFQHLFICVKNLGTD
jgi:hypothetical protein